MRVLIVDDCSAMRRSLRTLVTDLECEVVGEAENGLEAIEAATTLKPDLVLLDVSMPRMGGFPAARSIRAQRPTQPIIFVSAQPGRFYADEAFGCGGQGYVVKHAATNELPAAIDAVKLGKSFRSPLAAR